MSKKFTPAAAQPDSGATDESDPDVKVRKYSGHQYQTGPVPEGTAATPGYSFTGVTPGSECGYPNTPSAMKLFY